MLLSIFALFKQRNYVLIAFLRYVCCNNLLPQKVIKKMERKNNILMSPRRTERDTYKVTPEEKTAIQIAAKENGFKSKSEFIRQILMPVIAPYLQKEQ